MEVEAVLVLEEENEKMKNEMCPSFEEVMTGEDKKRQHW